MKTAIKRIVDILVCIVLSPFIVPIIGVCAVLIKLDNPGTVFFRQERLGRNRRPFSIVKLRTMVPNAEHMGAGLYAVPDDPRYTRIGPTLRRLSLDELPQLFNVVRGEMSLVGPRPPIPYEVECYEAWHRKRLDVKPGLTGLWQVSGRYRVSFEQMVQLDIYYIENWSLWLDLKIILKTLPALFMREQA